MSKVPMSGPLAAEFVGTSWLVLGGCGSAVLAAAGLHVIASGKAGFDAAASGFATNGFADHSPGGCSMVAALVCDVVMTFMFVFVILGAVPAGVFYRSTMAVNGK